MGEKPPHPRPIQTVPHAFHLISLRLAGANVCAKVRLCGERGGKAGLGTPRSVPCHGSVDLCAEIHMAMLNVSRNGAPAGRALTPAV